MLSIFFNLWNFMVSRTCPQLLSLSRAQSKGVGRIFNIFVMLQIFTQWIFLCHSGYNYMLTSSLMGRLSYSVSTMSADELAMRRAKASTTMELADFARNISMPSTTSFSLLLMCLQVQLSKHIFCHEIDIKRLLFSWVQMGSMRRLAQVND